MLKCLVTLGKETFKVRATDQAQEERAVVTPTERAFKP